MKQTIENLKILTGHPSDAEFAKFLGVKQTTIFRAKRGDKTKLHIVLPMLEYLISGLSKAKLKEFLKKFKQIPK
jgi:hypothetical protein